MPTFHAGAFYVQEASSMFLDYALNQIKPDLPDELIVIDMCAAPGGKTTLLQSSLRDRKATVWTNEIIKSRATILRENVSKWGMGNAVVTSCSPQKMAEMDVKGDVILVDAPCSGEGMFRKDHSARSEWTESAAKMCSVRQKEILREAWRMLKEGGYLIYSTCTFNPDENELNADWIIDELGGENVKIDKVQFDEIVTVESPEFKAEGYAFYPHRVESEGFFLSVFRKTGASDESSRAGKSKKGVPALQTNKNQVGWTKGLVELTDGVLVSAMPQWCVDTVQRIACQTKPLMNGVPVATIVKGKGQTVFTPEPELALAIALSDGAFNRLDVDRDSALCYLHGDTNLQIDGVENGWNIVCYDGLALGFVKSVGNRMNNYYPKPWRIRMNVN